MPDADRSDVQKLNDPAAVSRPGGRVARLRRRRGRRMVLLAVAGAVALTAASAGAALILAPRGKGGGP
ncbi:hypothetical protein, partial [Actinomadura fibrosa]